MTLAVARPATAATSRLWVDAPILTGIALLMALGCLPILSAAAFDTRLFQGDNVWLKPFKFHLALAIYTVTLAYFTRFMPLATRQSRPWQRYLVVAATAIMAELVWIGGAAALGTASHFNISTPLWSGLYALMGASAVTLTSVSLVMGVSIWRNRSSGLDPALRLSIALGLVLTFVLTLIAAGTMSSLSGHFVGTPVTGARLPVLGWSREVGDLRAPHFFATHALHAVPLAGLLATRRAPALATTLVWTAALGYTAFVLALFVQALLGLPVI